VYRLLCFTTALQSRVVAVSCKLDHMQPYPFPPTSPLVPFS